MKHYDTYYTHNHFVWMQNKQILGTSKSPSAMNSLIPPKHVQEPLGGFIWPPRSYTCSFCKRKFRSAQALGGHMNVHRRDRAKLKQSPPPKNQSTTHVQRRTSYHQQAKGLNDHNYGFPQENTTKNRSFQDHSLISTSSDKKIPGLKSRVNISCNNGLLETKSSSGRYVFDDSLVTVKDGKRCKKSDRYSGSSSMQEIDLELRLGHSPAACEVELSSVELGKF